MYNNSVKPLTLKSDKMKIVGKFFPQCAGPGHALLSAPAHAHTPVRASVGCGVAVVASGRRVVTYRQSGGASSGTSGSAPTSAQSSAQPSAPPLEQWCEYTTYHGRVAAMHYAQRTGVIVTAERAGDEV